MSKIAIIGGGLHGLSIFLNLPATLQKHTLIIDRFSKPFEIFFTRCQNIGMKYLRSPSSHMMKEPLSSGLMEFTKQYKHLPNSFEGKYFTPSLLLFKKYTEHLTSSIDFETHWRSAKIQSMELAKDKSWMLYTNTKVKFSANYIILALGMGTLNLSSPFSNIAPEKHILHKDFVPIRNMAKSHIAVIGGGMSGVQIALQLCKTHQISLITPKAPQEKYFDSNPCYIGPKCRNSFIQADVENKMNILHEERFKGTINPYVHAQLVSACKDKRIHLHVAKVQSIDKKSKQHVFSLSNHSLITVDDFVLATGFANKAEYIRSNPLLSDFVNKYEVPLNKDKMPILSKESVEIAPHVYVSGQLAEMTLGPPSNNIIGAHLFCRTMKKVWANW